MRDVPFQSEPDPEQPAVPEPSAPEQQSLPRPAELSADLPPHSEFPESEPPKPMPEELDPLNNLLGAEPADLAGTPGDVPNAAGGDGQPPHGPETAPSEPEEPSGVARELPFALLTPGAESGTRELTVATVVVHEELFFGGDAGERAVAWDQLRPLVASQVGPGESAAVGEGTEPAHAAENSEATPSADEITSSDSKPEIDELDPLAAVGISNAGEPTLDGEPTREEQIAYAIEEVDAAVASQDASRIDYGLTSLSALLAEQHVTTESAPAVLAHIKEVLAEGRSGDAAFDMAPLADEAISAVGGDLLLSWQRRLAGEEWSDTDEAKFNDVYALYGQLTQAGAALVTGTLSETPEEQRELVQRLGGRLQARANAVSEPVSDLEDDAQEAVVEILAGDMRVDQDASLISLRGRLAEPTQRAYQAFVAQERGDVDSEPVQPAPITVDSVFDDPQLRELADEVDDLILTQDHIREDTVKPGPLLDPAGNEINTPIRFALPKRLDTTSTELAETAVVDEMHFRVHRFADEVSAAGVLFNQLQDAASKVAIRKLELEGYRRATEEDAPDNVVSLTSDDAELKMVRELTDDGAEVPPLAELAEVLDSAALEFDALAIRLLPLVNGDVDVSENENHGKEIFDGVMRDLSNFSLDVSERSLRALPEQAVYNRAETELATFASGLSTPAELMPFRAALQIARQRDLEKAQGLVLTAADPDATEEVRTAAREHLIKVAKSIEGENQYLHGRSDDPIVGAGMDALNSSEETLKPLIEHLLSDAELTEEWATREAAAIAALAEPEREVFTNLDAAAATASVVRDTSPRPFSDKELSQRPPRVDHPYLPGEHRPEIVLSLPYVEVGAPSEQYDRYEGEMFRMRQNRHDGSDSEVVRVKNERVAVSLDDPPEKIIDSVRESLVQYKAKTGRAGTRMIGRKSSAAKAAKEQTLELLESIDGLTAQLENLPQTSEGAVEAIAIHEEFRGHAMRRTLQSTAGDALASDWALFAAQRYADVSDAHRRGEDTEPYVAKAAIAAQDAIQAHVEQITEVKGELRSLAEHIRQHGADSVHGVVAFQVIATVKRPNVTFGTLRDVMDPRRRSAAMETAATHGVRTYELLKPVLEQGQDLTPEMLDDIADAFDLHIRSLPPQGLGQNTSVLAVAKEFLNRDDPGSSARPHGPAPASGPSQGLDGLASRAKGQLDGVFGKLRRRNPPGSSGQVPPSGAWQPPQTRRPGPRP
ncbi:MAG: hypothetical protein HOQ05_11155 [Corynebacteriales bacterium]|nr:hypothetical protein [Mycobacteriales bacterium]